MCGIDFRYRIFVFSLVEKGKYAHIKRDSERRGPKIYVQKATFVTMRHFTAKARRPLYSRSKSTPQVVTTRSQTTAFHHYHVSSYTATRRQYEQLSLPPLIVTVVEKMVSSSDMSRDKDASGERPTMRNRVDNRFSSPWLISCTTLEKGCTVPAPPKINNEEREEAPSGRLPGSSRMLRGSACEQRESSAKGVHLLGGLDSLL